MKSYAKDDPDVILAIRKLMTHEMKIMGNSNNFPKKFRHNIVDNILNSTYEMVKKVERGELPREKLTKSYNSWKSNAKIVTNQKEFSHYERRLRDDD